MSGGAPGIVREVSTSSNPGSATGSLNDKGEAGKKLAAEKEKLSIPVQNSLKRLADAKDGKCDFKMLLLCDVKLTGADIAGLMPAVKTSCLRSLSLYGSGLTATTAKQLANALAAHESLTMLDLGNNALGSKGVEDVSNALIHNSSLLNLGLASTDMQDVGATVTIHVSIPCRELCLHPRWACT